MMQKKCKMNMGILLQSYIKNKKNEEIFAYVQKK